MTIERLRTFSMILASVLFIVQGLAQEPAQEKVKAAYENLPPGALTDDLGITVPVPASHPGRRYPAENDFPTGPAIGERIPDFELPNQYGESIDFHGDRDGHKAILVFYRSVVW